MWQKIEAIFRRKVEKLDTEKVPVVVDVFYVAVVAVFDVVDAVDALVVHGDIVAKDGRLK